MKTIEKIRQKIEELYDGEAPAHDQQCDFDDGYFTGIDAISKFLDTLESKKPMQEEQMLKEAVEAKIYGYDDGSFELIASWLDMPNNSIYKDGDKVRIIILKEEEQ